MSFVSVVGTVRFISFMSDGRAIHWEGDTFTVLPGRYVKFIQPTAQTFVAFGGRTDLIGQFLEETGLSHLQPSDYGAQADELQARLKEAPYIHGNTLIAYGGLTPEGKVEFCTCGSTAPEAQVFHPVYDPRWTDISFSFMYDRRTMKAEAELDDIAMRKIFAGLVKGTGHDTPEQVREAQKMLNLYVASRNPVVDNNLSWAAIRADKAVAFQGG